MTDTLIQAMESQRRHAVDLILKNGDLDFAYLEAVAAGEAARLVIDMPPPGAPRHAVFRRLGRLVAEKQAVSAALEYVTFAATAWMITVKPGDPIPEGDFADDPRAREILDVWGQDVKTTQCVSWLFDILRADGTVDLAPKDPAFGDTVTSVLLQEFIKGFQEVRRE